MRELKLVALPGIPEIVRDADLPALMADAIARAGLTLVGGDVLVIAQKIVSKAEGRLVLLATVTPSARAIELAQVTGKDSRLVELMLRESREVLRAKPGVLILEHRLGFIMAGAGIDQSNVAGAPGEEVALLLPEDADASAYNIQQAMQKRCNVDIGIIINDSFGRPWRNGVTGVAIGVAGVAVLVDMRGRMDRNGRPLRVTQIAAADELAAAASLIMGQADEGSPVVLARGFPYAQRSGCAAELLRPRAEDLFR